MAFRAFNPEPPAVADSSKAAYPSVLPAFFYRIAQANREFVVYDDGWRGWSYRYSDVDRMAHVVAARLRSQGIHKGDRVMIWAEGRPGTGDEPRTAEA